MMDWGRGGESRGVNGCFVIGVRGEGGDFVSAWVAEWGDTLYPTYFLCVISIAETAASWPSKWFAMSGCSSS